jgi:hypothetical protein
MTMVGGVSAPATVGPASGTQAANQPGGQTGSASSGGQHTSLPFTSSARRHREQMALANNVIAGGATAFGATQIPEQAIPAYGFLRGIWLRVVAAGGAGAGVVATADAPFSFLGQINITDPDGAPIYLVNSGYSAYIIHKYGGYMNGMGYIDPKQDNFYSGPSATGGNFQFQLWLPLEVTVRNGLGSLPNTDSGKQYKLNISTNASNVVYSTAPITFPTVTITSFIDCWTQPPQNDVLGRALTRVPPIVGTTQYWTRQSIPVNAGQSNGQTFGRVGNIVRGWVFIYRNAAGARQSAASGNWPNPAIIYRDGYNYDVIDQSNWLMEIAYRYGLQNGAPDTAGGPDSGVWPYMFCFDLDGRPGNELRGQWWPTLQSSRIELDGSYGVAGTLEVMTNDVAPTGDIANRVVF